MPALLSIEGCIVLCRLTDTRKGPTYREADSSHDPCVWIRDAPCGDENFWHLFYADEVIALLGDLTKVDFSARKQIKSIGAISHESEIVHHVSLTGRTVCPEPIYTLDWDISLSNFWESFPFLVAAQRIESARAILEPGQMIPVHPTLGRMHQQLSGYFENWKDRPGRPPHMFLPIHINRPEGA